MPLTPGLGLTLVPLRLTRPPALPYRRPQVICRSGMRGGSNRAEGWAAQAALAGTGCDIASSTAAVASDRSGPRAAAARPHRGRADLHGSPSPCSQRSTGSHDFRRRFLRSITVFREIRLGAARLHPIRLPVDGPGRASVAAGATEPAALRAARMRGGAWACSAASIARGAETLPALRPLRAWRRGIGNRFPLRASRPAAKPSAGPT
jgi:hypothetical protein